MQHLVHATVDIVHVSLQFPPELDVNSGNSALINAALTAGLFPKLLAVDQMGYMRTISNNQHASFHPSSVNFGRKPTEFGVNHLAYFTLMYVRPLVSLKSSHSITGIQRNYMLGRQGLLMTCP